jgi:hypothetical protein
MHRMVALCFAFLCLPSALGTSDQARSQPPTGESRSGLTQSPLTTDVRWSVLLSSPTVGKYCSGLVLSEHFVLTAAHCFSEEGNSDPGLQIFFASAPGASTKVYDGPVLFRDHPWYHHPSPDFRRYADIKVVYLQSVRGIDLSVTDRAEIYGDQFTPWCSRGLLSRSFSIVGWGRSNTAGSTSCDLAGGMKRLGSGFTLKADQCNSYFLVADPSNSGPDTCKGDSGSPWLWAGPTRWLAFAVTHGWSWHPIDYFITATAITPFIGWIEDTTSELDPRYALHGNWFYDDHFVVVRFGGDDPDASTAVSLRWFTW